MARVEDWEVDNDAVDRVVRVGGENGVFQFLLLEDAEIEIEAAVEWEKKMEKLSITISLQHYTRMLSNRTNVLGKEDVVVVVVCAK